MSNQSGVLTAFPQRLTKLQIAEVRAVQTPATLWKRYGNAVQSPRTPCRGVYFNNTKTLIHNVNLGLSMRQRYAFLTHKGCAVCALHFNA